MKKLIAILALATIPSVAAAQAPASHRFTRDGETYVYTSSSKHSRQVIDGYNETTGGRFHLVVHDDMVSGSSGGRPVSFRMPASASPIETAQR